MMYVRIKRKNSTIFLHVEPSGTTTNPRIPQATSILDYIACYLEDEFVTKPAEQQTTPRLAS